MTRISRDFHGKEEFVIVYRRKGFIWDNRTSEQGPQMFLRDMTEAEDNWRLGELQKKMLKQY